MRYTGFDALGRPVFTWARSTIRAARAQLPQGAVDPKTGLIATKTGYIRDPIANNDVTTLGPLDPIGAKLVGYYPTPTGSGSPTIFLSLARRLQIPTSIWFVSTTTSTTRHGFYFRYSYKQEFKTGTPEFWGPTIKRVRAMPDRTTATTWPPASARSSLQPSL